MVHTTVKCTEMVHVVPAGACNMEVWEWSEPSQAHQEAQGPEDTMPGNRL